MCARGQCQAAATTERVLLADLHVQLWFLLSLLGNWQADQFMCVYAPDFERGNCGEICAKNWGPLCVSVISETVL